MKKYCAYDGVNMEFELFDSIEEARKWLEEGFLDPDDGYNPNLTSCAIYKLEETVDYDVIDKKKNYKYEDEDDIPEDGNDSEAWPYYSYADEVWEHKFISVNKEK